jgi:YVTN family beta-propeller protein
MLEIMILISAILMSDNNISAQTYDTITKQREISKNNPQISLGLGVPSLSSLAVSPSTNKIYVSNSGSNTVSIIDSDSGNVTNLQVGISPVAIAVSPSTNKLYVANEDSNTVSVVNGKSVSNIAVGKSPFYLVMSSSFGPEPSPEKIYVSKEGSNTVSVINASSDKEIREIPVEPFPSDMAVISSHLMTRAFHKPEKIYLSIPTFNTISVINASSDKEIREIPVEGFPYLMANYNDTKIYATDMHYNIVHVINASSDKQIGIIPVGIGPREGYSYIAASPSTNRIYVTNTDSNTVSVINASSDKVIDIIHVGRFPIALAVSPSTNKIYVANSISNTVSVINASSDKVIRNITVGNDPFKIAVSSVLPSMIYVLNTPLNSMNPEEPSTNTVSVIDGSIDKLAAGITFNIHPSNSGSVLCNNKEYPTNIYLYVANGTKCMARPAKGFEFSSWVENLPRNSTIPLNQSAISDSPWDSIRKLFGANDTSATFDVNRFGTFTANFKPAPPSVPPEFWIPLYGIIVSTIVGWSIPSIIGWIKSKRQRRRANRYHKRIHSLYTDNNKLYVNDKTLGTLETNIKNAYAEGKISEQHYNNLKDETSILYERAYKNKIDLLNDKVEGKNNRIELDEIKNDVTDAYAEGKISEQHYNLLKEKIANLILGQANNSTHHREYKRSPI